MAIQWETSPHREKKNLNSLILLALGEQTNLSIGKVLYDTIENLLSRVAGTTTNSYIANHLNQYTNIDGQLLQYDTKGNLTSGAAHLTATAMDYAYDAQNRLTDARPSSPAEGDKRITFVYDGRNRCVKRNTYTRSSGNWALSTEHFLYYDGWNLIEERDDSGNHLASYVNGPRIDEPLARLTTNATYYYHGDALNSTVAMTGVSGTVAERYAFEAFGLPTIMDAVGNNITNTAIGIRHLFQGREWLAEVGLNDHRNRYYSPELQRWLTRDPILESGGVNLYLSFGNAPQNDIDPLGTINWGWKPPAWFVALLAQIAKFTIGQAYSSCAAGNPCNLNACYNCCNKVQGLALALILVAKASVLMACTAATGGFGSFMCVALGTLAASQLAIANHNAYKGCLEKCNAANAAAKTGSRGGGAP